MARNLSGTSEEQTRFQKFRRNDHLSAVSAIGGSVLLVGIVTDTVYYSIGQPKYTTQSFSYIALVLHVVLFLLAIKAFVYKTRAKRRGSDMLTLLVIVFNGLIFLLRVVLEMAIIDYRREYYAS